MASVGTDWLIREYTYSSQNSSGRNRSASSKYAADVEGKLLTRLKTSRVQFFCFCRIMAMSSEGGQWSRGKWQTSLLVFSPQSLDTSLQSCIDSFQWDGQPIQLAAPPSPKGLPLIEKIQTLLDKMDAKEAQVINFVKVRHKLHKLAIMVLLSPKWPYEDPDRSVQKSMETFDRYIACLDASYLSAQNQEKFYQFILQLSSHLRLTSISLEGINTKLVTKTIEGVSGGEPLFRKVRKLLQLGMDRILWPYQADIRAVQTFNRLFALYLYVYKSDANVEEVKRELKAQVDRLVKVLIEYNQQSLVAFFSDLMETIHKTLQEDPERLQPLTFVPLIWTLELLIEDETFQDFIRPFAQQENIRQQALNLFQWKETWRPIAVFAVHMGNAGLLQQILEQEIDSGNGRCTLDSHQLHTIFSQLNRALQTDNPLTEDEALYKMFLKRLAYANKLHFLKPYAGEKKNVQLLLSNLLRLGYSYLEGSMLPLESFFGNATFRALNDKKILANHSVRRALVRLFTGMGSNPVRDVTQFNARMLKIVQDFQAGFAPVCEAVLGKLGETTGEQAREVGGVRELIPVEEWLEVEVIDVYQAIKRYLFLCLAYRWEKELFDGLKNPLRRICLHDGTLYIVDKGADGAGDLVLNDLFADVATTDAAKPYVLKDLFNERTIQVPSSAYTSHLLDDVKKQLEREMAVPGTTDAVSRLTEAYASFHRQTSFREQVEDLLKSIFAKMQWAEQQVSFSDRVHILGGFLHVVSPFFKQIEGLIQERFFKSRKLKAELALNLIREAALIGFQPQETILRELTDDTEVDQNPACVKDLAHLLAALCCREIERIVQRCSLPLLSLATPQFENVICRKVDALSYIKKEFIDAFCTHPVNAAQSTAEELRNALREDLPILEEIMTAHGEFLRGLSIPIHFILPNQGIAIGICTSPQFDSKNMLLKLGTGQGKSLAIAFAALHEAKKIKARPQGRVLVLTSYDHLARRDEELGRQFFKKDNIKSLCISTLADVASFNQEIKILYADFENIDHIVREILQKMLQNSASQQEINFIRMIYESKGEDLRIILDEYDLLLHDLKQKTPFVQEIPQGFLTTAFVRGHHSFWPLLSDMTQSTTPAPRNTSRRRMAGDSGKEYSTVYYYDSRDGKFNLFVGVLRVSDLIKRAGRVVGFSGTALDGETPELSHHFFEIPSSQNPNVFGTYIEEVPGDFVGEGAHIRCIRKKTFEVDSYNEDEQLYIVSEEVVKNYCDQVVDDLREARRFIERQGHSYQRPVLIFADPFVDYATSATGTKTRLWERLKQAIKDANISVDELISDVSDRQLQSVASSGKVTLTTIKHGRGQDIRVSLDIQEGLHVIVATPVLHKRLGQQLIGRTGRMGRNGSYSALTLGELIRPGKEKAATIELYDALHELTRLFLERSTQIPYNKERCQKWLLLIGRFRQDKWIPRSQLEEVCGAVPEARSSLLNSSSYIR